MSFPPVSPTGANVNFLDKHAHHDINHVLSLLKYCLHEMDMGFWAQIVMDHSITVPLTDVVAFRSAVLAHIVFGDCVFHLQVLNKSGPEMSNFTR